MTNHGIEPADDGRCELHHGTVIAVGALPRMHMATVTHRDRHGHAHTDVQMSQYLEREVWIAAPGEPDRRFVLGENFGVLPGHELLLACAPGYDVPFRAHNLSTGQLFDVFQPEPHRPLSTFVNSVLISLFLAVPLFVGLCLVGETVWGSDFYYRFDMLDLAVGAYLVPFALLQFVGAPKAQARAARRLRVRRLVDDRLATFEARGLRTVPVAAGDRPLAFEPAPR